MFFIGKVAYHLFQISLDQKFAKHWSDKKNNDRCYWEIIGVDFPVMSTAITSKVNAPYHG